MDSSLITGLVVWYVVFLFSTTMHEACHAFAAAHGGDYTAYQSGQATLNPLPHIQRERFGMVVVPIVTYFLNHGQWMIGWASAPFNPMWAARHPRRSFFMSLAGPLSHIIPVTVSWVAMLIGLRTGFFAPVGADYPNLFPVTPGANAGGLAWPLAMFLDIVFQLNLLLLVFNLLPLPPMDGSEIWYLFIKREEDRLRWRYTAQSYAIAGLLLAWYLFPRVFHPIMIWLVRTLYSLA